MLEKAKQEKYELYKATKLYVRNSEYNLLEVWKLVNGKLYGEELTTYCKETILAEYRNTLTEQRIKQMYDIHRVRELGITLEQYREDLVDFYKKQIKYKVFKGTFNEFVEAGYNLQLTDF